MRYCSSFEYSNIRILVDFSTKYTFACSPAEHAEDEVDEGRGVGAALRRFSELLPDVIELKQLECTWQRAGACGRLDRVHTSLPAPVLASVRLTALVSWTIASGLARSSDHVPVLCRLLMPTGRQCSARVPCWVFPPPARGQLCAELLKRVGGATCRPA